MKKILAIAIAFVMVFAIASTAFAGIGFPAAAVPKSGGKIDVIGLEGTSGAFRTAAQTYNKYDQTKGVVAGTDVTFLVTFTAARYASPTALFGGTALDIDATNLTDGNGAADNITYWTVDGANGMSDLASVVGTADYFDDSDLAAAPVEFDADLFARIVFNAAPTLDAIDASSQTLYILFSGYKVAETKDAVITARWLAANNFYGFTEVNPGEDLLTITKGGVDYDVWKIAAGVTPSVNGVMAPHNSYDVAYNVMTPTGAVVSFDGSIKDAVNYTPKDVYVNMDNVRSFLPTDKEFMVTRDILGNVAFASVSTPAFTIDANADGYKSLKTALDTVLGIYGWSYNIYDGVLNDAGFETIAGSRLTQKATWTYYAYTNALTVSGTTAVPDTGDMSIVGIALVVVAVIATAAVVIKKVRA